MVGWAPSVIMTMRGVEVRLGERAINEAISSSRTLSLWGTHHYLLLFELFV